MQKKQQKEQKKPKQKKLLNTWKCFMVLRAVNWQLPFLHQFQRFQIRNLRQTFQKLFAQKGSLAHPYYFIRKRLTSTLICDMKRQRF